jgi:hypothetical protein
MGALDPQSRDKEAWEALMQENKKERTWPRAKVFQWDLM